MARPSNGSGCPKMGQQFLLKHAACLDKQASVDRLMGDALAFIIRVFSHKPACDLLRGPFARQLDRYHTAKILIACQLARFGTASAVGGWRKRLVAGFWMTLRYAGVHQLAQDDRIALWALVVARSG